MQAFFRRRDRGDAKAIAELEKIGPPSCRTQADLGVHRKWARAYEMDAETNAHILSMALFESDDTGCRQCRGVILQMAERAALGSDFAVPIFVFEGAEDDIAPAQSAKAVVDGLTAPQKEFVAIEGAGHRAMYTKSAERATDGCLFAFRRDW